MRADHQDVGQAFLSPPPEARKMRDRHPCSWGRPKKDACPRFSGRRLRPKNACPRFCGGRYKSACPAFSPALPHFLCCSSLRIRRSSDRPPGCTESTGGSSGRLWQSSSRRCRDSHVPSCGVRSPIERLGSNYSESSITHFSNSVPSRIDFAASSESGTWYSFAIDRNAVGSANTKKGDLTFAVEGQ